MPGSNPPSFMFAEQLAGVRVLLVEDHPDSRDVLHEFLTLLGAVCETAPDLATARAKLSGDQQPDIVISDIGLPDGDGYALSRWVRERISVPPPMIALTASGERRAAIKAGFVRHLLKPVDVAELVAAIHDVLRSRSTPPP